MADWKDRLKQAAVEGQKRLKDAQPKIGEAGRQLGQEGQRLMKDAQPIIEATADRLGREGKQLIADAKPVLAKFAAGVRDRIREAQKRQEEARAEADERARLSAIAQRQVRWPAGGNGHWKPEQAKLAKPGDSRFANIDEVDRAELLAAKGITLGHLAPSTLGSPIAQQTLRYGGERHIVTFATNGSGKQTTMTLPAILQDRGSALIVDPKGQHAAVTARARVRAGHAVKILDPFDLMGRLQGVHPDVKACRVGYNPLTFLNPKSPFYATEVAQLAEGLLKYNQHESAHWVDAGRSLISALIMAEVEGNKKKASFARVRAFFGQSYDEQKVALTQLAEAGGPLIRNKIGTFRTFSEEVGSIINSAKTQTDFLDDPLIAKCLSKTGFKFADMKQKPMTVYLVLPTKMLGTHSRWMRLIVSSALNSLLEMPGDPVLFLLDEFAQIGRLEAIETTFAAARGYGVKFWLMLQDLPQLKTLYPERWESFVGNAGVTQIFTPNDMTTAEYFSKRIGSHTITRENKSYNTGFSGGQRSSGSSTSYNEEVRPLYSPEQLFGMGSAVHLLFGYGVQHAILGERTPYWLMFHKDQYDPDPYYLGATEPDNPQPVRTQPSAIGDARPPPMGRRHQ